MIRWLQLPVNTTVATYILRGHFRSAVEHDGTMSPESIEQAWRSAMSQESRAAAEACYRAIANSLSYKK